MSTDFIFNRFPVQRDENYVLVRNRNEQKKEAYARLCDPPLPSCLLPASGRRIGLRLGHLQ